MEKEAIFKMVQEVLTEINDMKVTEPVVPVEPEPVVPVEPEPVTPEPEPVTPEPEPIVPVEPELVVPVAPVVDTNKPEHLSFQDTLEKIEGALSEDGEQITDEEAQLLEFIMVNYDSLETKVEQLLNQGE